jgi:hypothetical protein
MSPIVSALMTAPYHGIAVSQQGHPIPVRSRPPRYSRGSSPREDAQSKKKTPSVPTRETLTEVTRITVAVENPAVHPD